MELLQLRIFSLAAKYLNFSKVATALFISPPSISKYIAALEAEIGHHLFVRDGRQIALTDFGESFLRYANEILAKEEAANRFLSSNKADNDIRYIGIITHMEGAPPDFYAEILAAKRDFERIHPSIEVKIRFHDFEDLQANLTVGNIDIALFSINNAEIPSTLPDGMLYRKLKHFSYSLAVPHTMTAGSTLAETAQNIKTLAFVNHPAPVHLARRFTTEYRIVPKLIPMSHWGQPMMKMISGECATFLSENWKEVVAICGVHLFDLPSDGFSNGLYALWWANSGKSHTGELAECLAACMIN